jgi:hypothetical protein
MASSAFSSAAVPLLGFLVSTYPCFTAGASEYYASLAHNEQEYIIDYVQRCVALQRDFADRSESIFQEGMVLFPHIDMFHIWNDPSFKSSQSQFWDSLHNLYIFAMQLILGYDRYSFVYNQVKAEGWLLEPQNDSETLLSMILAATFQRQQAERAYADLDGVVDDSGVDRTSVITQIPSLLSSLTTAAQNDQIDPQAFLKTKLGMIAHECAAHLDTLCKAQGTTTEQFFSVVLFHLQKVNKMEVIPVALELFSQSMVDQSAHASPSHAVSDLHEKVFLLVMSYVPAGSLEGALLREFYEFSSPRIFEMIKSSSIPEVIDQFSAIFPESVQHQIKSLASLLQPSATESLSKEDQEKQRHTIEHTISDYFGISRNEFEQWKTLVQEYTRYTAATRSGELDQAAQERYKHIFHLNIMRLVAQHTSNSAASASSAFAGPPSSSQGRDRAARERAQRALQQRQQQHKQ